MGTQTQSLTVKKTPQDRTMASYKFFIIALVLIGAWAASASPIEVDDAEEHAIVERGLDEYKDEMSDIDAREEKEEESDMEERSLPGYCNGKEEFYKCHLAKKCKSFEKNKSKWMLCRKMCKRACDEYKDLENICKRKCEKRKRCWEICKDIMNMPYELGKMRKNFGG